MHSTSASTGVVSLPGRRRGAARPAGPSAGSPGGLSGIPASSWDALLGPDNTPLRHGLLLAWEQSELRGLQSRPLVAAAPGSDQLRGACPGYFYDLDLLTVRWPATARFVEPVRRLFPRFLYVRAYELGTAVPLSNPFLVSERESRQAVVRALVGAGLEEARRGGATFLLVQNFASLTVPAGEALRSVGMAPVPIPPTAVVDLPYSSFEEYLSSMRAQYRRRARQTLDRTRQLEIEHRTEFADVADELARLWRSIYDRAKEIRREILTPAFFRAASTVPESSVLLAHRPDGSIAAFALLLADGPMLSFLQCGFEEQAGRGEGAYFRLLYEIVRFGIEQGFKLVDLGVTTLAPKLDVGGVPVPLYAWVSHRNPVVQRLIVQLARCPLQRERSLAPRRVFKQPQRSAEELVACLTTRPRQGA